MKKLLYISIVTLFFSSCLDEVDLPTEPGEPKVVVDGLFTDINEKQLIKLSYSTTFTLLKQVLTQKCIMVGILQQFVTYYLMI